ncbi:dihydroxyacetone kinase [Acetobacter orleanensis NRIC 0473]|nr:dihydroxyacetone kinase [Acetobacter orleanensis NRIC 0473]
MLDAAVSGSLFASPSVDAILAGILAVTGEAGCLLVIKSYTGDRLNFALAAEQARSMGYQVETVVVGDDIALPDNRFARGLAGTLLVHKVAGYVASQGEPLARVAERARAAAAQISSIGLSLTDCNAYDPAHATRLTAEQAELGLGIHGEPGAQQIALAKADDLMALAADTLARALPAKNASGKHERYGILLNMLGSVPPLEMTLLLNAFAKTDLAGMTDLIIGPAPMMTALDMNGFSLTAIPLTEEIRAALNAPVEPAAWPGAAPFAPPTVRPLPALPETFRFPPSSAPEVEAMIRHAAQTLISNADALNALDAQIGDGDAGSTFAEGAQEILKTVDRLPLANPQELFATFGAVLARHAGGSSGVLLSIMFSAAGRSTGSWSAALLEGLTTMQQHGGAKPGDRTMIDALHPAFTVLAARGTLAEAAQAARAGADATGRMTHANAGRASYVPDAKLANVPDPGAEAIARLFEALASRD